MSVAFSKKDEFRYGAFDPSTMNVEAEVIASDFLMRSIEKDGSLQQLVNVAMLPGLAGKVIAMPDIHQGYGFPIGGTAAFDQDEGLVSPGGVGYDINCGMLLIKTDIKFQEIADSIPQITDRLYHDIPAGNQKSAIKNISMRDLESVCSSGSEWAMENGYCTEKDRERMEDYGSIEIETLRPLSNMARQRGINQLLTIGSGNHFVEIQRVQSVIDQKKAAELGIFKDQVMVMVHTGSRGLGHQVASDFMKLVQSGHEGSILHPIDRQLNSAHIKSRIAADYLNAMNAAANFAYVNRAMILWKIRNVFRSCLSFHDDDMKIELVYALSHNMAKFEEHVISGKRRRVVMHRKGSTRAFGPGHPELGGLLSRTGQPVIVPGDMGTASYVLVGNESNESLSYGTCCHGAGRMMSRKSATEKFQYNSVMQALTEAGITVKSSTKKGVVEEAPGSYKNIDSVIDAVSGSGIAKPVCRNLPVGVIKG